VGVFRTRQRRWFRQGLRVQALRGLSATPCLERIRRDRHRSRHSSEDHPPARRAHLGGRQSRLRGHLLLHPGWKGATRMTQPTVFLVGDHSIDEGLTLPALQKANVGNTVVVVRDGAEALDYLFARGAHVGRDAKQQPQVVLLDLNLPKIGGLDVLRAIRADERTKLLPVVILTSSKEDNDLVSG